MDTKSGGLAAIFREVTVLLLAVSGDEVHVREFGLQDAAVAANFFRFGDDAARSGALAGR